jgi:hypothetical protein
VRRFISIQVLLTLVPAVFSAPFLHMHGHRNSGHFMGAHQAQALVTHTHLAACRYGHRPGGGATIIADDDDDDAIPLNWFQNHPQPVPHLEFVLVETAIITVPEPSAFWIEIPTHRSHDPPLTFSLNPRSPPATPSSSLGA